MGLKMATPTKRKRSRFIQFRRGTPADLLRAKEQLAVLGVRVPFEAYETLKTSEPAEAKRLHSEALLRWEAKWGAWRKLLKEGPRVLSQKDIFAIVGEMGRDVRQSADENPGEQSKWQEVVQAFRDHSFSEAARENLKDGLRVHLEQRYGWPAVAEASLEALLSQFINDLGRIASGLETLASGDYREPDWLQARPSLIEGGRTTSSTADLLKRAQAATRRVTFEALIAGWSLEINPKSSTMRAYRNRLQSFTEMLGHDDARRVTSQDVRRWRGLMLEARKVSRETIRDRLAALSALLQWGFENELLSENVAVSVKLRRRRDEGKSSQKREFTEKEAGLILRGARKQSGFLRWGPWIMAYTAMRVGEVAQLRRNDMVQDEGGKWHFRVTPEAGNVKSGSERSIPLHPALESEGLVKFIKACKGERLFPQFYRDKDKAKDPDKIAAAASQLMARWVRGKEGLGMTDLSIRTSHSWRHFFNTMSRDHEVDLEVRKSMVGHLDNKTAADYGTVRMKAKRKQMEKIPALKIDDCDDDRH